MQRSASDPKELRKAKLVESFESKQEMLDWQEALKVPCVRRIMWRLLGKWHLHESTFTGNNVGIFMEGKRNAALEIWGKLVQFPDVLLQMMQEAKRKEESNG